MGIAAGTPQWTPLDPILPLLEPSSETLLGKKEFEGMQDQRNQFRRHTGKNTKQIQRHTEPKYNMPEPYRDQQMLIQRPPKAGAYLRPI